MSAYVRVIGIDPGPTPGIVRLHAQDGRLVERWTHVVQCSHNVTAEILGAFLAGGEYRTIVQVERFVVRGRATPDQSLTRDLVGLVQFVVEDVGARYLERGASQVKPWATDERLAAAGLLDATTGMRHARDAARHALFAAVKDGGLPDPLSKEYRR